ncbi:hypothetical protein IKM56_00690 [Candidatus Saccharibacteria bacterium]|nr:hypothetical protein [Candidatus Saccharibacteria bacterium]
MAENNQVNGQSGEPRVSFDSAKIADKERVEQFTNIAGEKERKAAAERAKKEAEKKQQAARDAKIEQVIELRKAEKRSKKPLIIIGAAVVLIALGVGAFIFFNNTREQTTEEKIAAAKNKASEIGSFVDEKTRAENLNEAYDQIEEKFQQSLSDAKNDYEKYYILMKYASFKYTCTNDEESIASIMEQIDSLTYKDNDIEYKCSELMYRNNDEEWVSKNPDIVTECTTDEAR